jgi:hypothetical protein
MRVCELRDEGVWVHRHRYTYRLPDGRELEESSHDHRGPLSEELVDLQQPYRIEVEYLPEDPTVSRIKGGGSQGLSEWIWRDVGLGGLLLAIFLLPGIRLLDIGVHELRRSRRDIP